MSSLIEKVLMIGFGATICLSLFSLITPIMNDLHLDSANIKDNHDVLNFYEMITEIRRKTNEAIQFPGQVFRIHKEFSNANEIHFAKSNNSRLNLDMEKDHQVFIEMVEFEISFEMKEKNCLLEVFFYGFTRPEGEGKPIEITFDLVLRKAILYLEF